MHFTAARPWGCCCAVLVVLRRAACALNTQRSFRVCQVEAGRAAVSPWGGAHTELSLARGRIIAELEMNCLNKP